MNASFSKLKCPQCGRQLAGTLLRGLCPECLALVAFEDIADDKPLTEMVIPTGQSALPPLLAPGVRYFGDYELLNEVGRGGMGVVYRARQVSLNRVVAVKMNLAGPFAGSGQRKRFQREAEAAARLRHPNIVAIHEVGEHEGRGYFSMDFIEGRTLATVLRESKLSPGQAATLIKTTAEAVHFAHTQGTLHRDLKPQNILVTADGQPHILDFGLARSVEGGEDLTRTGDIVGTPSYMSPEQAAGRGTEVGPACDVYSLGAILYEAITGRPPFVGDSLAEVLRQVLEADPASPRRRNPNIPADLATICLKCLEKRPERRYTSAAALAQELGRFLNFEPIQARPAGLMRHAWSWTQQHPWFMAAGCGLLVLGLACVAYGFWEESRCLTWRMRAGPGASPPRLESPASFFLRLFPGMACLAYFAGRALRRACRRMVESGGSVSGVQLLLHGVLGVGGVAVGLGHILRQIRVWVWRSALSVQTSKAGPDASLPGIPAPVMLMEWLAVACALVLVWVGFQLVWEAAGMHETSRFRDSVDGAIRRQLAAKRRHWPFLTLVALPVWILAIAIFASIWVQRFSAHLGWGGMTQGLWDLEGLGLSILLAGLLWWWGRSRSFRPGVVFGFLAAAVWTYGLALATCNIVWVGSLVGFPIVAMLLAAWGAKLFSLPAANERTAQISHPPRLRWELPAGLAFFVLSIWGFYMFEDWRGRRAWLQAEAAMKARGESGAVSPFSQPTVPDDQNVLAHPFMKRLLMHGEKLLPVAELQPVWVEGNVGLADLRKLPRRSDPSTAIETLLSKANLGGVVGSLSFTNEPLHLVVEDVCRRAGVPYRAATNHWPPLEIREGAWRHRLVTCSFTNATPRHVLGMLAQRHLLTPDAAVWRDAGILTLESRGQPTSLQDLLDRYAEFQPRFTSFEEALARPRVQVDPARERFGFFALEPYMGSPWRGLWLLVVDASLYRQRCEVHLLAGEPDAALADLRTIVRLVEVLHRSDPTAPAQVELQTELAFLMTRTLEETLAARMWPDSHLDRLQAAIPDLDLFSSFPRALHAQQCWVLWTVGTEWRQDRAGLVPYLRFHPTYHDRLPELLARVIPEGWLHQNRARYAQLNPLKFQGMDPVGRRLDPRLVEAAPRLYAGTQSGYRVADALAWSEGAKPVWRITEVARSQTQLDQARLACALERWRAAHGQYPDTLDRLVPEWIATLPKDLFDGQPMRYRRTEPSRYTLYSIGWNAQDDLGVVRHSEAGDLPVTDRAGDWVWAPVP